MNPELEARIFAIERPHNRLIYVYLCRSLHALLAAPLVFFTLFLKYISLRYQFDEEGVGASWGVIFKKQIFLTYARIQDIHVSRDVYERWLGLGTVEVQTASGSASAELAIVGMEEFDEIRDFLYSKMRGARGLNEKGGEAGSDDDSPSEALTLLHEIRDELREMRNRLPSQETPHV